MKIIKQGIVPSERGYRATCAACSAVFEFQKKEATYVPASYRGDHPALVSIECPTCGNTCNQNEDNYIRQTDAEDRFVKYDAEAYYSK